SYRSAAPTNRRIPSASLVPSFSSIPIGGGTTPAASPCVHDKTAIAWFTLSRHSRKDARPYSRVSTRTKVSEKPWTSAWAGRDLPGARGGVGSPCGDGEHAETETAIARKKRMSGI